MFVCAAYLLIAKHFFMICVPKINCYKLSQFSIHLIFLHHKHAFFLSLPFHVFAEVSVFEDGGGGEGGGGGDGAGCGGKSTKNMESRRPRPSD